MIKVLVVDDSVVFRTQISSALGKSADVEVVGTAPSGSIALQKLAQLSVDVVTLDMEMPDMNGIEVLREIKRHRFPVRVIIFSSQTQRGAEAALSALREGADDVVAKPSGEHQSLESVGSAIQEALLPKVLQFREKVESRELPPKDTQPQTTTRVSGPKRDVSLMVPSAVVIGSSTGGPAALEKVFQGLTGPLRIPIFIVQHMPPVFTDILAKRLGALTGIPCAEAKAGERVHPNHIYVAPGDQHLLIESQPEGVNLALSRSPQRNSVRPAADYLFETAAEVYGASCLGIVLTGMGEDSLAGAKKVRERGGGVVIQDRESCVVFGMPGAIFSADEYDLVGNLDLISSLIKRVSNVRGS